LQIRSEGSAKNGGHTPSFNSFLAPIKTAGLTEMLANEGPFMLFAPADEAFKQLPKDKLDALLADPKALADVVRGQIVNGYFPRFQSTSIVLI
jgi:uncharacterized surface protein with fasciclin (FAS1) repeats